MAKQNYVDNKKLTEEVTEYSEAYRQAKKDGDELPIINEYIGTCIMKIAEKLSHRPNFMNYTYREEMVGDGIENCLKYVHNFNIKKTQNAFAYVTQIIYYAFLRRIKAEKKQQYIKYKLFEEAGIENVLGAADERADRFLEEYNGLTDKEILMKECGLSNSDMALFEVKKNNKKEPSGLEKFYEDENEDSTNS